MNSNIQSQNRRRHTLLLAAVSAAALAAGLAGPAWASCSVSGTQDTWSHGSSGNWNTPADWSGGLPSGNSVCIVDGKSTVTLNSLSPSIVNLQLGSGNTLDVTSGEELAITGTEIENSGTINLSGSSTNLNIDGSVVLSGGGTITLASSAGIFGGASSDSLTNVDNTIEGAGTIGGHMFDFTNEATVDANSNGGTLQFADINTVTNTGTMEATNGGTLYINLTGFTVDNAGGLIEANGGTVNVESEINGGTLTTANGGTMQTEAGTTTATVLNGVTISSGSTYSTAASSTAATTTTLEGTIVNEGTLSVAATKFNAELALDGNVTLEGGGIVRLGSSGTGSALIEMSSGTGTFTNVNNDIEGAGTIDSGSVLTFKNEGMVDANLSGGTLFISSTNVTNSGTFEADAGATLDLSSSSKTALTNFASSTLTGGTYNAESGIIELGSLGSSGGEIVTNDANILLSGSAGIIEDFGLKNALSALATNDSGASFTTESGQAFSTSANFSNSGLVTVGNGSSFTDTHASSTFTNQSGAELQGTGTVAANTLFNYGTVKPGDSAGNPGTLSITGNFTQEGTGTLDIEIGGTSSGQYGQLDISGTSTLAGTLAVNLVKGFTLALGEKFDILNAGTDPGDFSAFSFNGQGCVSGAGDSWHCSNLGGGLYFVENFLPGGHELDLDVVPEPASLLLFGSALMGAGWCARRKKRPA